MDWDNIKAADIMVLLSSFLPAGGVIHKITVSEEIIGNYYIFQNLHHIFHCALHITYIQKNNRII